MICSRLKIISTIVGAVIFIIFLSLAIVFVTDKNTNAVNYTTEGIVLNTACYITDGIGSETEMIIEWNLTIGDSNIMYIQNYIGRPIGCEYPETSDSSICCSNLLGKIVWFYCSDGNNIVSECTGNNKIIAVSDVRENFADVHIVVAIFLFISAGCAFGSFLYAILSPDKNYQTIN